MHKIIKFNKKPNKEILCTKIISRLFVAFAHICLFLPNKQYSLSILVMFGLPGCIIAAFSINLLIFNIISQKGLGSTIPPSQAKTLGQHASSLPKVKHTLGLHASLVLRTKIGHSNFMDLWVLLFRKLCTQVGFSYTTQLGPKKWN